MALLLLLNAVVEGATGFFFLFYPQVLDYMPGFGQAEGDSVEMLTKMYGVATLMVALLSTIAYFSRDQRALLLTSVGLVAFFHFGITTVQYMYNPDYKGTFLHGLLFLFFLVYYFRERSRTIAA